MVMEIPFPGAGEEGAGVAAAILIGGALGLTHALLTISLRAEQVVTGLAITLAGTGARGTVNGPAGSAKVAYPMAAAIDHTGDNLFFTEGYYSSNSYGHSLRKLSFTTGMVTTAVGGQADQLGGGQH